MHICNSFYVNTSQQYLWGINRMGNIENTHKPKRPIRITDCNVVDVAKYELSAKDMKTDDLEGIVQL